MRKTIFIFFIVGILIISNLNFSKASYSTNIDYIIEVKNPNDPITYITTEITGLTVPETFELNQNALEDPENPKIITKRYVEENFKDLEVLNLDNGKELEYEILKNGNLKLVKKTQNVRISYTIIGDLYQGKSKLYEDMCHLDTEKDYVFFAPTGVLYYPMNSKVENINLRFDMPNSWVIISTYSEKEDSYFCPKYFPERKYDLYYGATLMGVPKILLKTKNGDTNIYLAYFGVDSENQRISGMSDAPRIAESLENVFYWNIDFISRLISEFREIYGEFPMKNYLIFDRSQRHFGTEWAFGLEPQYNYERISWLVHHMNHTYTYGYGASFLPLRGEGYTCWLNEGLSVYLEHKLAYEVTENPLFLGRMYTYYLAYKLKNREGLIYDLTEDQLNNYLICTYITYVRGEMTCFALDEEIRKRTNEKYDLFDVLKTLYKSKKGRYITNSDVLTAVNKTTGKYFSDFFREYIFNDKPLDPLLSEMENYREYMTPLLDYYAPVYFNGYNSAYFLFHDIGTFTADIDFWGQNPIKGDVQEILFPFLKYVKENYNVEKLTKEELIEALEYWTGVDQSDFFDFYSIDDRKPDIEEIRDLIKNYDIQLNDWREHKTPLYHTKITPFEIIINEEDIQDLMLMKNCDITILGEEGKILINNKTPCSELIEIQVKEERMIIAGNNTPDIEYAEALEEGLDPSIGNVRFLVGGPVANDLTKKLMEKFSKEISNEYPGTGKGIIEVKKIGGIIYVLLAGSDRDGTNAAVQIFLGLGELPDIPIIVDWNDGNPKVIEE